MALGPRRHQHSDFGFKGNIVDWSLKAPGFSVSLDGIEFATLPSGLHALDEDVLSVLKIPTYMLNCLSILNATGISLMRVTMVSPCFEGVKRQTRGCEELDSELLAYCLVSSRFGPLRPTVP